MPGEAASEVIPVCNAVHKPRLLCHPGGVTAGPPKVIEVIVHPGFKVALREAAPGFHGR